MSDSGNSRVVSTVDETADRVGDGPKDPSSMTPPLDNATSRAIVFQLPNVSRPLCVGHAREQRRPEQFGLDPEA